MDIVKKIGWQFYLVNPYEHMYENVEDVPSYINEVMLVGSVLSEKYLKISNKSYNSKAAYDFFFMFLQKSLSVFFGFILLETIVRTIQGKGAIRLNESLMSITHGLMMTGSKYVPTNMNIESSCNK